VEQKLKKDLLWLMNGGGMVPNQKEYSDFLKKALEIPTVSANANANANAGAGAGAGAVFFSENGPGFIFPVPGSGLLPPSPGPGPFLFFSGYFIIHYFIEGSL
jgi:hypothetical protein